MGNMWWGINYNLHNMYFNALHRYDFGWLDSDRMKDVTESGRYLYVLV